LQQFFVTISHSYCTFALRYLDFPFGGLKNMMENKQFNFEANSFFSIKSGLIALIAAVVSFSYLFMSPLISDTKLSKTLHKIEVGRMVAYQNGDAAVYLDSAKNPESHLLKKYVRQSRPLYASLTHIIGLPIIALLDSLRIKPKLDWMEGTTAVYQSIYILFNFIYLFLSMYFFNNFFSPNRISIPILSVSTLFVTNEVTKTLFWTATPSLISILVPIVTIALSRNLLIYPRPNLRLIKYCFFVGVLWLYYGGFATTTATLFLVYTYLFFSNKMRPPIYLMTLLGATFTSVLSVIVWGSVCYYYTKGFYNHEIEVYREFVWVFDTLQKEGWIQLLSKIKLFFGYVLFNTWNWAVLKMPALLLCLSLIVSAIIKVNFKESLKRNYSLLVPATIAFFVNSIFYGFMGYFAFRLCWNMAGSVLVISGVFITELESFKNRKFNSRLQIASVLIFISWWLFVTLKNSELTYWS
jgi:hypothetical protein